LRSESPAHLQVDGDYLGERDGATFRAVPNALRIIA
jgi:diacylglycerol kinase family enzyme